MTVAADPAASPGPSAERTTPEVSGPLTSLRIQTVLFHPAGGEVERLFRGLGNAVRLAKGQGRLGPVHLAVGDCSAARSLSHDALKRLELQAQSDGIDAVSYEFFGENLGSAAGHNRLLMAFEGPFVLIINPDVFASPHVLLELALPLWDKRIGIVEARQIPLEHPKDFNSVSGDTSWASTAGALVRHEVIDAIGGFDADSFFLYCDDVDFSWRTRLAGFRVVHQPTARIFHDKRLTTAGRIQVGQAEVHFAAESALILAWKYSRPDLVTRWLDMFTQSQRPGERKVAEEFRIRRDMGYLPEAIDPDRRVGEFFGDGAFAYHRFSYDD
ncbi:MAG TPA: glycosyltransferase family 2 protein [Acidimicrobiales bacterium]|nr:glycosyltransferase family 2 protein [Acidimicrobiales bacterium]